MAKRKRPTTTAEVPSDLLDAVHRVPWECPDLSVDALDDWHARFARLRAHRGYTKACTEAVTAVSTALQGLDWSRESTAFLAGCIEANLFAQRGVDRFGPPRFDHDTRTRRTWYTAWWIQDCWERGIHPEPLLSLLVIAFEGGPPALAELWRRCKPESGSFAAGVVRLLAEVNDEGMLPAILTTIRERGRRWVPKDRHREARKDIAADFDAATWEVLHERFGTLTPVQVLFLGLDQKLSDIPGAAANRLRERRRRRDLEIEVDPVLQDEDPALQGVAPAARDALTGQDATLVLRELERLVPDFQSLLTQKSADLAAASRDSLRTIERKRHRLRAALDALDRLT